MCLGAKYQNNRPIEQTNYPAQYEIKLSYMTHSAIKESVSCVPSSLLSLKHMDKYLCHTMCYEFKADDKTFVIPCFEVVRCLFGKYAFILNTLLHSGGLNSYIESEFIDNGTININFTDELKSSYLQPAMINEIVWIKYSNKINQEWESVYTSFIRDKKIIAHIPPLTGVKLLCNGFETKNTLHPIILVQSIQLIDNRIPFKRIYYTHPQKIEQDDSCINTKSIVSVHYHGVNTDFADDQYATVGNGTTQTIEGHSNTFIETPIVANMPLSNSATKSVNVYTAVLKQRSLTTNQTAVSGTARSVEFETETSPLNAVSCPEGFEKFMAALDYLHKEPYNLAPYTVFYDFDGNTAICFMENGQCRKWAYSTIHSSFGIFSIIEVCIVDGLSLSTLIIFSKTDPLPIVQSLIQKLMGGKSWHKDWLKPTSEVTIYPLKHNAERSSKHWAELIISSIEKIS
jgi:hypothetical protein